MRCNDNSQKNVQINEEKKSQIIQKTEKNQKEKRII